MLNTRERLCEKTNQLSFPKQKYHNINPKLFIFSVNSSLCCVVANRGLLLVFSCWMIFQWAKRMLCLMKFCQSCNHNSERVAKLSKPSWVRSISPGIPSNHKNVQGSQLKRAWVERIELGKSGCVGFESTDNKLRPISSQTDAVITTEA